MLLCLECEEEPVTAGELYHHYGLVRDYGLEVVHETLKALVASKLAIRVLSDREVYLITKLGRDTANFRESTARAT